MLQSHVRFACYLALSRHQMAEEERLDFAVQQMSRK